MIDEWGPEKTVTVFDSKSGMRGVLVIDNTARGIGKGGTRMSPTLTIEEVTRLARTMTLKWAASDLFYGGAKAGILASPNDVGKERILRAFASALKNEVPSEYVFGLDMGLTEQDAAIFIDELGTRAAAVGLPRELGGLPYDDLGVTGFGVAEATASACEATEVDLHGARVSIQGFGAVGHAAAVRLVELGACVAAVSTVRGSVSDRHGLDIPKLSELREQCGDDCVLEYGQSARPESLFAVETDILVPAAREDVVDEAIATETTARIVVEGANLPTSKAALDVLYARGIVTVPDFIANAGGIVAAAITMDARQSAFPVDPATVMSLVSSKLRANVSSVLFDSVISGITPHAAARALAEERVRTAMRIRGRLPVAVPG